MERLCQKVLAKNIDACPRIMFVWNIAHFAQLLATCWFDFYHIWCNCLIYLAKQLLQITINKAMCENLHNLLKWDKQMHICYCHEHRHSVFLLIVSSLFFFFRIFHSTSVLLVKKCKQCNYWRWHGFICLAHSCGWRCGCWSHGRGRKKNTERIWRIWS